MLHYSFKPFEQLEEIHQLPDPFLKPDGTRISNADEWPQQRQYLKEMLAYYLYGEMPPSPGNVREYSDYLWPRKCTFNGFSASASSNG